MPTASSIGLGQPQVSAMTAMPVDRCSRVTFRAHVTRVPVRGFSSIAHSALAAIDLFLPLQALPARALDLSALSR